MLSPDFYNDAWYFGTLLCYVYKYALAVILPSLTVSVQRLHDTNKLDWWLLLVFVPFGGAVLLVMFVWDLIPSTNQYGENPKGL